MNEISEAYYLNGKPQKPVFAPLKYCEASDNLKEGVLIVDKHREIGRVTHVRTIRANKGGRSKFAYEYMLIDSEKNKEDLIWQNDIICIPTLNFVEYICLWIEEDGTLILMTTDGDEEIEGFEVLPESDMAKKIEEMCEKSEYECIVETYIWNEKKIVRSMREGDKF